MTIAPEVSVLMSVFNSAESIERTVESILSQQDVELEFIVVDDGSEDDTPAILDRLALNDPRLKVIHQANTGLTVALANGARQASGRFIARQDAGGDVSLPGRLRKQVDWLRQRPDAVMVSCGTRFVGPNDEILFDVVMTDEELATGLSTLSIPGVRGPSSHPSTLFTRQAYEAVGGYRSAYVVAQDMDLWLRLVELGPCLTMPDLLYQTKHSFGSISSRMRDDQLAFGAAAIECARSRRLGLAEPSFPMVDRSWKKLNAQDQGHERFEMHYFLGSCLSRHNPLQARKHFWQAIKARPVSPKVMVRILATYFSR